MSALTIEVPADRARWWSLAVNPGVLGAIECSGAAARIVDAHLVVHPDGGAPAVCRARYLDSPTALRRMLERW